MINIHTLRQWDHVEVVALLPSHAYTHNAGIHFDTQHSGLLIGLSINCDCHIIGCLILAALKL